MAMAHQDSGRESAGRVVSALGRLRRGSHAVRRAATRAKVFEATIACLHELGYAPTSTPLVAERAGVSRGAMLHQFPTKADLIVAVTEYLVQLRNQMTSERLAKHEPGLPRLLALTDAYWEVYKSPYSTALLEVLMGCRSDRELQRRLRPVLREVARAQEERVWRLAEEAGVSDREAVNVQVRHDTATMRGLAIDLMAADDSEPVEAAFQHMRDHAHAVIVQLAKAKKPKA